MKNWTQDPRELLPMHLKLRRGLQFDHLSDQVEASIPEILEPTKVTQWQYRLMLTLDGERTLMDVVKDVHSKFPDQFEAGDVWIFLDWMIAHNLIFLAPQTSSVKLEEQVFIENAVLPDEIETGSNSDSHWARIPLQTTAIIGVCLGVGFVTYLTTPTLVDFVRGEKPSPPAVVEDYIDVVENAREPEMATTSEMELAADAGGELIEPIATPDQGSHPEAAEVTDLPHEQIEPEVAEASEEPAEEPETEEEPDVIEVLMSMRQELVACQIRRDEYYLLNDEKGYRKEVAKISELAKEIGAISAAYENGGPTH